jgi:hypothetical protein
MSLEPLVATTFTLVDVNIAFCSVKDLSTFSSIVPVAVPAVAAIAAPGTAERAGPFSEQGFALSTAV